MRRSDRGGVGQGFAIAIGIVLAMALVAGVVLGGWLLGWWFKTQNTNRDSRLYQHQYGYQSSLREDVSNKLATITEINVQLTRVTSKDEVTQLKVQRIAVAQIVCKDAEQIDAVDQMPSDQQQWVSINCANGSVSADSSLRR